MLLRRLSGLPLGLALTLVLAASCTSGPWNSGAPTAPADPPAALPRSVERTAAAPVQPPPRSFTIAASGDLLVHEPIWERAAGYGAASGQAFDFRPMFARVRSLIARADLAICHLETPLSRDNRELSSYPVFSVPWQVSEAIAWTGYDRCSTASNHSLDRGLDGIRATLEALDAARVGHAGTARTRREARPALFEVKDVVVAHLSYTYGLNGFRLSAERRWAVNVIDTPRILRDARDAKARGAEFVIVSLHWGEEFQSRPTTAQRPLAKRLLASPAVDLILGHHAHVVQPIAKLRGKYVVYGMGNFLSNMSAACCPLATQDGIILRLRIDERVNRFVISSVRYIPIWVEQGTTWRILPVARALRSAQTPPEVRAALRESWRRTVQAVTSLEPSCSSHEGC
jgi:hypothetical protein